MNVRISEFENLRMKRTCCETGHGARDMGNSQQELFANLYDREPLTVNRLQFSHSRILTFSH